MCFNFLIFGAELGTVGMLFLLLLEKWKEGRKAGPEGGRIPMTFKVLIPSCIPGIPPARAGTLKSFQR